MNNRFNKPSLKKRITESVNVSVFFFAVVIAIFLVGTAKILVLLPWLLLSGTVAGLAVGLLGAYLLPRLPRSLFPGAKTTVPAESSDAASSVSFEDPSDRTNDRKDG